MSSAACQTASICAQVVFWGEVLNANRMSPTVVQVLQSCRDGLRYDVSITLLAAGLIFLLALVLGGWKSRQILVSDDQDLAVLPPPQHQCEQEVPPDLGLRRPSCPPIRRHRP